MRFFSWLKNWGHDTFIAHNIVSQRDSNGQLPPGHPQEGATAIEYGLIAALIAVAALTVMINLGNDVSTNANHVAVETSN